MRVQSFLDSKIVLVDKYLKDIILIFFSNSFLKLKDKLHFIEKILYKHIKTNSITI